MWWTSIASILGGATNLWSAIFGNKQARDESDYNLDKGAQDQYAAEFYQQENVGIINTIINAVNRIVRPAFAIYIGWLVFYLPIYQIDLFLQIVTAYQAVPDSLWAIVGIIIIFYFGGRMQMKSLEFNRMDVQKIKEVREEIAQQKKDTSQDLRIKSKK